MHIYFYKALLLLFFSLSSCEEDLGMSLIGLALEGFSPCPDGEIFMSRYIGLPPSRENYWNGTFYFDKYPGLSEARIFIKLKAPAVIKVDPEEARINFQNDGFYLTLFEVHEKFDFVVNGRQNGKFPNILSVELNGKKICKSSSDWEPTILGSKNTAATSPLNAPDIPSYCGRKKVDFTKLITNSFQTKHGEWPWHVALYWRNNDNSISYKCGATLIGYKLIVTGTLGPGFWSDNLKRSAFESPNYQHIMYGQLGDSKANRVEASKKLGIIIFKSTYSKCSYYNILAAHCVSTRNGTITANRIIVYIGKYDLSREEEESKTFNISEVIRHENFDPTNLKNDIALLKTSENVIYTDYIQPACLWSSNDTQKENIFGLTATVVGWGLNEDNLQSNTLRAGNLKIVSDTECLLSYPNFFGKFVSLETFCAGNGPDNRTNACNGDSGGGLMLPIQQNDLQNSWILRGIVSLSVSRRDRDACDPSYFTIYTDAAKYIKWIEKHNN